MKQCQFCNVEHTVAVPLIHSNGTSALELHRQLVGAVAAVQSAIGALHEAAPNNRDFYPLHQEARAQADHTVRARNLCNIREELAEMLAHVQAVIDFAEERKRARAVGKA